MIVNREGELDLHSKRLRRISVLPVPNLLKKKFRGKNVFSLHSPFLRFSVLTCLLKSLFRSENVSFSFVFQTS